VANYFANHNSFILCAIHFLIPSYGQYYICTNARYLIPSKSKSKSIKVNRWTTFDVGAILADSLFNNKVSNKNLYVLNWRYSTNYSYQRGEVIYEQ
jgi:hypothetical protein